MKTLAMMFVLALVATQARAQDGFRLEFYGDEALSSCELAVTTPGLAKVHMIVKGPGVLGAIAFKAPKTPCMRNMTWVADVWSQPYMKVFIGNTQGLPNSGGGVDVIFDCAPLPRYIGYILYAVSGPADPCCSYAPSHGGYSVNLPYPDYLYIIAFHTCPVYGDPQYDTRMEAKGIVINPNPTCACNLPLSDRATTWGSVKALYR